MCCGQSRMIEDPLDGQTMGEVIPWSSHTQLAMMGRTKRFEHSMPFHTLRVDIFEGNVKRMVRGKTYVTLKQLRFAFKYRPLW